MIQGRKEERRLKDVEDARHLIACLLIDRRLKRHLHLVPFSVSFRRYRSARSFALVGSRRRGQLVIIFLILLTLFFFLFLFTLLLAFFRELCDLLLKLGNTLLPE